MKKILLYISVATVLFSSCAKEQLATSEDDGLKKVNLLCAVGHAGVSLDCDTKGIINPETEFTDNLDIAFLRADRIATGFNSEQPWYGLDFKNNIPGRDEDTDRDNPKYRNDIQYYWSTAKISKQADADYYRRVTDYAETQYFKGLDDYAQYLAWYPRGTVNSGDGTLPFSITQNLDLQTDVMISNLATESITGDYSDTLLFKHALCQFRIHVYRMQEIGDDGEFVTTNSWGYLRDIVVENNTRQMTYTLDRPDGTVTYNYDSRENLTLSEQHFPDSPGTEGVFFKPNGEILVGYDQRQYVACFLAAPPKEGILQLDMKTVKNLGTETPLSNSIAIASDFKPGYAYDVVLCFSDHGIVNAEASLTEWSFKNEGGIKYDVTASMYYDLSRYGTSNSYIVASSNVGYTFKGNVKGCGNENGGAVIAGCDDWTLPDDSYIEVIYTSDTADPEQSQLLQLDNHLLINGNVTFSVPGNPENPQDMTLWRKGNAIIAAYDYKGGNILWSWHIWITDRPKDQGYGSGFTFMDRNLGALVAPTEKADIIDQLKSTDRDRHGNRLENGFYYQWGRKDPIIPGWSQYSGDQVDIATATKNVSTFYGAGRREDDRGWHTSEVGVDDSKLWGYSSSENMVKSVYDPCPPGYRLPEHASWFKKFNGVSFINYHNTAVEQAIATEIGHKSDAGRVHVIDDESGNGCITGVRNYCAGGFYSVSGSNVNVWYPGTGWIYAEKASASGPVVPYSTETNVYAANNAYSFNAVKAALDLEALIDNADACPVRCVSVNSVDMVTNLSKTQTANCYIIPSAGDYKFKADVKGNGANRVSVGGTPVSVLDVDVNISHSKASFYTVLWWQGDLSGADGKTSNASGSNCPIKFANSGKRLPASPGRTAGSDFTDDDITVMDSDGFIQFRIEESDYCHGNAIVAAFDVNRNILWSWHLWLTDEPSNIKFGPRSFTETYAPEGETSVTITSTKTYYAMDRNLGSTYLPKSSTDIDDDKAIGSYGMYYQWGRKDPFPGPSAVNVKGNSRAASSKWWKRNVSGNFSWTEKNALESANPVASREDAIPTPTTFYKNNFTSVFSTLRGQTGLKYVNWHTTDWEASDNRSKYISMWGCSSDSPKSAYNPRMSKTINDPCPPGYYIPDHYLFAAGNLGTSGMVKAMSDDGASVDKDFVNVDWPTSNNYGVFINANGGTLGSGLGTAMWLPYAGYRNGIDGKMMNTGEYNMYGEGIVAELFGLALRLFGIDPNSHIAAQYHCAMDFNAFSKNSTWSKTYVRALSVRPDPDNTSVIQAGQLANLPADGTPIRCRAY